MNTKAIFRFFKRNWVFFIGFLPPLLLFVEPLSIRLFDKLGWYDVNRGCPYDMPPRDKFDPFYAFDGPRSAFNPCAGFEPVPIPAFQQITEPILDSLQDSTLSLNRSYFYPVTYLIGSCRWTLVIFTGGLIWCCLVGAAALFLKNRIFGSRLKGGNRND